MKQVYPMTSPTPSAALFDLLENQSIPLVIFDPRVLVGAMVATHATAPDERFVNAAKLYHATTAGCFLHCNSVPLMDMFSKLAQNPEKLRRAPAAEPLPHHGFMAREAEMDDTDEIWTAPIPEVPVRECITFIRAAHDLTLPVETVDDEPLLARLSPKGRELAKVAFAVCDNFHLAATRPVYLVTGELSVRRFSPDTLPFKVIRPAELVRHLP